MVEQRDDWMARQQAAEKVRNIAIMVITPVSLISISFIFSPLYSTDMF